MAEGATRVAAGAARDGIRKRRREWEYCERNGHRGRWEIYGAEILKKKKKVGGILVGIVQ